MPPELCRHRLHEPLLLHRGRDLRSSAVVELCVSEMLSSFTDACKALGRILFEIAGRWTLEPEP